MKKIILSTLLVGSSMFAGDVTVAITDIINKDGSVYIGLYTDKESFTIVEKNYKGAILKIDSNTITYTFKDVPNGVYAISLFHDENNNKIHDKNFFGIPSEGYGFSNNIRPSFRSANFKESKFEVTGDKALTINMGY